MRNDDAEQGDCARINTSRSQYERGDPMDVLEAIKTRRSVRRYRATPVPEDLLKTVLNAARLAPSANNAQPWRIIVVTDEDLKVKLVAGAHGQKFLAEAPVVLVACGIPDEAFQTVGGYMSSHVMDVSIALDHLTLAAHSVGLGTCWVAWFKEDKVREVLGIPEDVRVVAMTPLGYPDESPERTTRRNLEELVLQERYQ
jgi:nitroreductase